MSYLPRFASCRDIGHKWDYFEWHGGHRTLICDNCDTRRMDSIDSRGRVSNRQYRYPKGYHWEGPTLQVRQLRMALKREAAKLDRWIGKKPPRLRVIHGKRRA